MGRQGQASRNQERSDATRGKIVQAARELVIEHGYEGVSTAEVMQRAGVSRGGLYHHFDGRTELMAAVLAAMEEQAIERLRGDVDLMHRLNHDGLAWGHLKAFFNSVLPPTLDDRDAIAFNLVPKALIQLFGPRYEGWHAFKRARADGSSITYVRSGAAKQ